jgi:hypothetical protein
MIGLVLNDHSARLRLSSLNFSFLRACKYSSSGIVSTAVFLMLNTAKQGSRRSDGIFLVDFGPRSALA